jgi:hypothetical protein
MPTEYTTPIVIPNETRAAPVSWGVRLVYENGLLVPERSVFIYEIGYFNSNGQRVRQIQHNPQDDLAGLSTAIKNELRAVHNRVRTVARGRGELAAGTDTDDF